MVTNRKEKKIEYDMEINSRLVGTEGLWPS